MRSVWWRGVAALCVLALAACAAVPEPVGTLVPVLVPPGTPESTSAAVAGALALVPEGAQFASSLEADADGDGTPDLVLFYVQGGEGRGQVRSRAGDAVYPLNAPPGSALFRERLSSVLVRDVTGDGKPEIVVEGVLEGTAAAAHVFQWNGRAYALLLSLRGEQGVAGDDPHGNGVLEFTALQTLFQRSAIFRATTAEWSGSAYAVHSDVLFVFGAAALSRYPEEAVLAYYRHWQKGEPQSMWDLLGGVARAATSTAALETQVRNSGGVRVEQLRVDEESDTAARVTADVRLGPSSVETAETHTWRLERGTDGKWQLTERAR